MALPPEAHHKKWLVIKNADTLDAIQNYTERSGQIVRDAAIWSQLGSYTHYWRHISTAIIRSNMVSDTAHSSTHI